MGCRHGGKEWSREERNTEELIHSAREDWGPTAQETSARVPVHPGQALPACDGPAAVSMRGVAGMEGGPRAEQEAAVSPGLCPGVLWAAGVLTLEKSMLCSWGLLPENGGHRDLGKQS